MCRPIRSRLPEQTSAHRDPSADASPPGPPATCCSHHTVDIDEQASLLRGWQQQYQQLSGGMFVGKLTEVDLGDIQILQESTSQALLQHGCLPPHKLAIGIPLLDAGALRFCGQTCHPRHLIIFSGPGGFEFHSPGQLTILDVVIDITAHTGGHDLAETALPALCSAGAHLRALPLPWRARLQQLTSELLDRLQTPALPTTGAVHAAPPVTAYLPAMRLALLDMLHEALAASTPLASRPSQKQLRQTVADARALMRPHDGLALPGEGLPGIGEVCRQLQLSRRSLQHAFQQVLGIPPLKYLRLVRLNAARRNIKQHGRVADAATANGFWHLGRFSQDYARLFGEPPSQTARRHR